MSLSEFAVIARRAVIYFILGIIAYFILSFLYRLGVKIYLSIFPPAEPPPTVGFGILPKLNLQQTDVEGTPTYILDTATGQPPAFDDRAEVVAMADQVVTLLGEVKARELASKLDFGGSGTLSSDRKTLTFRDEADKRTLAVNVTTQDFELTTDLARIAQLPKGRAISGTAAITQSRDLLFTRLGLLKYGFEAGNQTTGFFAATKTAVSQVSSSSEAQITEVNYFRSLTDVGSQTYPILPHNPKQGLIRVWLTSRLDPEILNTLAIYYYAAETEIKEVTKEGDGGEQVTEKEVETYPIKTSAQAWEEVQSGKKLSYSALSGSLDSITITNITLAYFEDTEYQKYLQPIYVFSGVAKKGTAQGEFITYIQAVSPEWVEE